MNFDLFDDEASEPGLETIVDGAVVLRGFATGISGALLAAIDQVAAKSPFRHMETPGGHSMSAAMTCCGELGWVTDRRGYRYEARDPVTGQSWPRMPPLFLELASEAAAAAGFDDFVPDACLINRYRRGSKMGLHQDRDERDFSQPIVSVSLGLPMVFQFGGPRRGDRPVRVPLGHGDVVVWGGKVRRNYHGVLTLKAGDHPLTGACRYNLTFRKAG
ncbi:DNA oxidative demethylase AlkB [Marinobacter pelagius]|uniref:DNA oxidative demethylase AlkB n=1 Tax=Marinobacter sp. C7 TaxID=2951363 RepID=UPI001EF07726|nr:DNA oxidative demethylase AlkB [Marinobacter sp. C7]MCG7201640.1 DNA oxidative demethylase AlkB [Marinobacter sp. C7]